MKLFLTILSMLFVSKTVFATCEIKNRDGSKAGSVINQTVLDSNSAVKGVRISSIVKVGKETIVGFLDVFEVPVYRETSYWTAQISNKMGEDIGTATSNSILDKNNNVVGSYNSECSIGDAGAAALLLIFGIQ